MNADVFPIVVSLHPEKLLFGGGRGRGPEFLSGGAYKWHFTVTNNYGKHCKFVNCNFRGGSRGRVQGVRTAFPPPPAEMTGGFLIQLVFCEKKKNYVAYWCPDRIGIWKCWFLRRGETGVHGEKPLGAKKRTNNKLNPHARIRTRRATLVGGERSHHCATPILTRCADDELSSQIIDVGVILHKGAYFRDWWNVIDALVVTFNLASLILE